MSTTKKQNNDKIQVLDDRQKSREKLAVWYGSRSNFMHGSREVIANGTDEIINNFDNGEIEVTLFDDLQTMQIKDTGRGIPLHGKTDGVENYELLFRTLFAGTKYEQNEDNLTGTNGVGNTVLCYTSTFFKVESWYGGNKHTIVFENGGELTQPLKKEKCDDSLHGTQITFKLDPEVYTQVTYSAEEIKNIVKSYSVGSNKVTLKFIYGDEETSFHYNSLEEYFAEAVGNNTTSKAVHTPENFYDDENETTSIKLSFATSPEVVQESYLNLTYLSEGGSFNEGVIAGARTFLNKYCKDKKMFPKSMPSFSVSDIENSLSFVLVALSNKVEFTNQTKLSTTKTLYKKLARKHTIQAFEILMVEDEANLKKIANHVLSIQKHNEAAQKAKAQLKKKLTEKVDGIGHKVEKLVDCKFHGKDSEIFIAEGNSALGSIILARDPKLQAGMPLRGKILNCLKADYHVIFKNQIILDLIKVLGCGIEADNKNKDLDSFDIDNLRYGKIIIATDADSDGANIACLIITMFYRLMPTLIEKGYIYLAQTPLYEVKMEDDTMLYFFSESEKEQKLPKIKGKYTIARVKGLGEMDAETMSETAMNPATRNLMQVTVESSEEMIKSIETWMGIDVENRKQFISENLDRFIEEVA